MTKKKYQERRLLVVSKRRVPSDEGLARLVAAMVLHQLNQSDQPIEHDTAEDSV